MIVVALRPPCELVVRYFLPQIRARIAKILIEERGWKPAEVARVLKVTTSSIIKYKRIISENRWFDEEALNNFARRITALIITNSSHQDLIGALCKYCFSLRILGDICRVHRIQFPDLVNCSVCSVTLSEREEEAGERFEVIRQLHEALSLIATSSETLVHFVPEVRTNIVMALEDAESVTDVAAFPGRLTVVKNRIVAVSSPEFGGSKHMARILLEARRVDKSVRALMCIKYDRRVEEALRRLSLRAVYLEPSSRPRTMEDFSRALMESGPGLDVLVDKGGYGVEPVAYIFGKNAIDAVRKAIRVSATALRVK